MDSPGSKYKPMARFCEYDDEPLGPIIDGNPILFERHLGLQESLLRGMDSLFHYTHGLTISPRVTVCVPLLTPEATDCHKLDTNISPEATQPFYF
jgi:hypothetical protein